MPRIRAFENIFCVRATIVILEPTNGFKCPEPEVMCFKSPIYENSIRIQQLSDMLMVKIAPNSYIYLWKLNENILVHIDLGVSSDLIGSLSLAN